MAGPRFFPATTQSGARLVPIVSPLQYALDGSASLRILCANSESGVAVTVAGYRLDEAGEKHPFLHTFTPVADRSVTTRDLALGAGALMNLTAYVSTGTPLIGQTFIVVNLIRGFTGATVVLGTLLSGYLTARQALGWPGSPLTRSTEGQGFTRMVLGATPAAGAEFSVSCPTGARWQVLALRARLTTSAVAANRIPILEILNNATDQAYFPQFRSSPAGASDFYVWGVGLATFTPVAVGFNIAPLPVDLPLVGSVVLVSLTQNLQAADQWSLAVVTVREWLEVNT